MKRKKQSQPSKTSARQFISGKLSAGSAIQPAWIEWIVPAVLAIITLIVFWPVVGFDFINYDDPRYVTTNAHVLGGLTWENFRWAFQAGYASNWHPLTWISLMLKVQLFGAGAAGFHAMNLFLHAANTVLLFFALRQLSGAFWRSAFVAALFALHPLHVESVAWISELKDVLSTFFTMWMLIAYNGYVKNLTTKASETISDAKLAPRFGVFKSGCYWLALFSFVLGLMSKPMLVTMPLVLLLLDYWPLQRREVLSGRLLLGIARLTLEKIPFFLLSLASCGITFIAQKNGGAVQTLTNFPLDDRIENAFVSYARYLGKTFWPENLTIYYPYPHWPLVSVILAIILVVGLCLGVLKFVRRFPFAVTGWGWFLGMMIPVIGLVQVGNQSMADRYAYMPSIGLFIVFVWGADEIFTRWRLSRTTVGITAAAIMSILAWRTTGQLRYWQDSESLFRHAIAVTEPNGDLQNSLGEALLSKGQVTEAIGHFQSALEMEPDFAEADSNLGRALVQEGQTDAAMIYFQKALEIDPGLFEANNNLAVILAHKGQLDEAIAHYKKALESEPDDAKIHHNLANALLGKNRVEEAIAHYQRALEINPALTETHRNLGVILAQRGQIDEAIFHFQKVLESEPNDSETENNLASALLQKGRLNEATAHYQKALALNPNSVTIQNNLAHVVWILATSHDPIVQDGVKALELAQQTDQVSGGKNPAVLGALAAAYAATGKFQEAVGAARSALEIATTQHDTGLANTLQTQIKCYSAGTVFFPGAQ